MENETSRYYLNRVKFGMLEGMAIKLVHACKIEKEKLLIEQMRDLCYFILMEIDE